jgi:hypothetical protein
VPSIAFRFDGKNERAQRTAEKLGATMVREVSEETRAAIRAAIARGIREGIPPYDLARLIAGTETTPGLVGLTLRQMHAVLNHRQELIDPGLPLAKVEKQTARLIKRQLRRRAVGIARTETMYAYNRGADEAWQQAQKANLLGRVRGRSSS